MGARPGPISIGRGSSEGRGGDARARRGQPEARPAFPPRDAQGGAEFCSSAIALKITTMRILAIVPSGYCYGLQNLTLAFFGDIWSRRHCYFPSPRWTDGPLDRLLYARGYPPSQT